MRGDNVLHASILSFQKINEAYGIHPSNWIDNIIKYRKALINYPKNHITE